MAEGYIFGSGAFGAQIWQWIRGKVPFYPLFQNFFINRKLPIYVDMNNLMLVYLSIPSLRTIIDKKADMIRNARLYIGKRGDKEYRLEKHPVLDLLRKPNDLQNWHDFISQWEMFKEIYANAFIYKLGGLSFKLPQVLYNLPPGEMKIIPTGKLFFQTKVEEIIEKFTLWNSGQYEPIDFRPKELMFLAVGTSDKYFFGESKIMTNKIIISNIDAAYKTRNIILHDRGPQGIISSDQKDSEGGYPIKREERKRLEKQYHEDYGLNEGQQRVMITTASVKWQPTTYPTKDMMLFEEVDDDKCQLLDAYGVLKDVFSSTAVNKGSNPLSSDGKGKTEEALKITYETTIQSDIDAFCNLINHDPQFGLIGTDFYLCATFDHLPVMQEDQVSAATVIQNKATAYQILLSNGVIDKDEFRAAMGYKGPAPKAEPDTEPKDDAKDTEEEQEKEKQEKQYKELLTFNKIEL